ncbi:hypothetical protein BGZ95_011510 [Linnemannia exigua]|uniref:F-box domain-containing protein n=1 Tax=Linnemannia exigua TaxID=604196 RepID=A0AAD4D9V9_9FUNG|nr:hypothetical protein BGZ95_011510 [Linnemannia exigua]
MTLALELPEILYRIGYYLDANQVLACSLVCRTFYNAYSPLVWKDLHFSLTKDQLKQIREKTPLARKISFRHLFEGDELERDTLELVSILQGRSPWLRSLTIHQHESVQQFSSFGPGCNRVETMSIEGIPLKGDFGDQTYWKSCKALLRQNRPDLRSLSLQNWKVEWDKPLPGQPVWNPILACTQHLNLTSLSLVRCKIRGKHLKAFWTISARLEALELDDVDMDLTWIPSSFLKDKDKDKAPVPATNSSHNSTTSSSTSSTHSNSAPVTKRALPPPDLPPRFPKLQTLSIRSLLRHHPLSQFYWLVLPCPSLRTLNWMFDNHRYFATKPFMDAFEDTLASPTAWPHLDSITIKGHSNWISDEIHLQILTTARQPLKRLDILHHNIQPKSFEVLQARHFATIQTIDLTHTLLDHASKWAIVVLESCPSLERIQAKVIRGQDIIKSRPWACQGLREWIIAIDMDFDYLYPDVIPTAGGGSGTVNSANAPTSASETTTPSATAGGGGEEEEEGTPSNTTPAEPPIFPPPTTNGPKRRLTKLERQACRSVYKRFSTLTRLREFNMLHSHSMNYLSTPGIPGQHLSFSSPSHPSHPSHRMISLPLRLHLGLAYLARLDRLEKFCFWNGYTQVRHKEIQWILEHWKGLKQICGGFSIPNRKMQTVHKESSWSVVFTPLLKDAGKVGGISTEGSRYLRYDDSAEVLEAETIAAATGEEEEEESVAAVTTKAKSVRSGGTCEDDDTESEPEDEYEREP